MNYNCKKCLYKTHRFPDIVRHLNRKKKCDKTLETIKLKYNENEFIRLSLIPYSDNVDKESKEDINILKKINKNIVSKEKMFELLHIIDKNKMKSCPLCDMKFSVISDVRTHLILDCISFDSQVNNEKTDNSIILNNNNNLSINGDSNLSINGDSNVVNNTINNNINISIIQPPISFDDKWDITHLNNDEKTVLILSMVKYTKTLEYLLKNKNNQNVLIDKDSNLGLVYNNNSIEKMSIEEICDKSFNKIHDHLKNFYDDVDKINTAEVDKKYIDTEKKSMKIKYLKYRDNDDNAKKIANENLVHIFDKVKDETIENFNEIKKLKDINNNINGF
jgi:hypothetical protein